MSKFFAKPVVRLAGRAIVAGLTAGIMLYQNSSGGSAAWHAAVAAGVLAFVEVFTPLNSLVGVFKAAVTPPAKK